MVFSGIDMRERIIPIWWFCGNFDLLTEQHIQMKLEFMII